MSTGKTDPLLTHTHTHTPLSPHVQYTTWLPHTHTSSPLISPVALRWGLPDSVLCVWERICEQIRNDRESHSSCSPALRGSRSAREQSQGHQDCHRLLPPVPFVICTDEDHSRLSVYICCTCVPGPVWSEDEDEGAVSASGPWPEEGAGTAGTRLWLCSALSVQEEAQSLPARTGRFLYTLAFTSDLICLSGSV